MLWTWKACAAALTANWSGSLAAGRRSHDLRWRCQFIGGLGSGHKTRAGKIDLTIGSALDIFGGSGVKYEDCVKFNQSLNL